MPEGSGKSGGFSLATIFLFILAFLGIGAPLMLSTTHPTSFSAASSGRSPISAGHANTAEGLLEEFYDTNPDEIIDSASRWQHHPEIYPALNEAWSDDDPRRDDRISFLITTVPNPENPSLRYQFDRYIDSIQRALSHENYLLDKTYLPWVDQLTTPSDAGSNEARLKQPRNPGPILFRRHDIKSVAVSDVHRARENLVVVFVVSETPTDGVEAALRSALEQIAWLRGWAGTDYTPAPPYLVKLTEEPPDETNDKIANEVKIVGPSYPVQVSRSRKSYVPGCTTVDFHGRLTSDPCLEPPPLLITGRKN
jgi:hypothetical protein